MDADDEHPYHAALEIAARRRFGSLLHLSIRSGADRRERGAINGHLADISRIPSQLADRLIQAGLTGVFIGVGSVADLDNLQHLRDIHPIGWRAEATYADVPAVYDRDQRCIVVGTVGITTFDRHDFLHECGHALGHLLELNDAPALRQFHLDASSWIQLPPYFRGRFSGDPRGMREVFAELFRDRILDRSDAVTFWGADLVEWLEQELRII